VIIFAILLKRNLGLYVESARVCTHNGVQRQRRLPPLKAAFDAVWTHVIAFFISVYAVLRNVDMAGTDLQQPYTIPQCG
jgi:hypothetical protein